MTFYFGAIDLADHYDCGGIPLEDHHQEPSPLEALAKELES